MPRKTTSVLNILEQANKMLSRDDEFATAEFKIGIICMIEDVLHDTGNYCGFMFMNNDDSDTGTLGYYSRQYFYSRTLREASGQKKLAG